MSLCIQTGLRQNLNTTVHKLREQEWLAEQIVDSPSEIYIFRWCEVFRGFRQKRTVCLNSWKHKTVGVKQAHRLSLIQILKEEKSLLQSEQSSYLGVHVCIHVEQGVAQRCADLWQLWPSDMFSDQTPQRLAGAPELVSIRRLHTSGNLEVKEWRETAGTEQYTQHNSELLTRMTVDFLKSMNDWGAPLKNVNLPH